MKENRHSWMLYISVLAVFGCSNCMGAIDGALSKIADAMQVSSTTALYVGSMPALTAMFSSLAVGMIAGRKLPYKATAIVCSLILLLCGILPVFTDSFAAILLFRCLFGFGFGGIMCIQNPIVTRLIPSDKRPLILGLGTCVAYSYQCILQLVGGVLADIQWNYVFLTYLLLLFPMAIVVLRLPKMELSPPETVQKTHGKLPAVVYPVVIMVTVVSLHVSPLLFGGAFYAAPIMEGATVAAIIAMSYSIGCMAGGLLFPILYRHLKRRCFAVFLPVGAVGLYLSASANTIVLLGAGFFIGGVSFSCIQAGSMLLFGLICSGAQLGFASALIPVAISIGGFFCPSYEALIGSITGDALYAPLYIGVLLFLLMALIVLIRPPFPKEHRS